MWFAAIAAVLVLSAGPTMPVDHASSAGPTMPVDHASSAGPASVIYPDGLVVRLAGILRLPPAAGATCDDGGRCRPGAAPGLALLRVDITLGLPGSARSPVPLDVIAGTAGGISLLAGPGRRAAAIDCGFVGEDSVLCTDSSATPPTRVDPGTEVTVSEAFDVPVADVTGMTVTVRPQVSTSDGTNPLPTTVFRHAETALTG